MYNDHNKKKAFYHHLECKPERLQSEFQLILSTGLHSRELVLSTQKQDSKLMTCYNQNIKAALDHKNRVSYLVGVKTVGKSHKDAHSKQDEDHFYIDRLAKKLSAS